MTTDNENKRHECADYTSEQLEALQQTDDYKAFEAELTERIQGLNKLIKAHRDHYGCAIVISVVSAMGNENHHGMLNYAGTISTVSQAIKNMTNDAELDKIFLSIELQRLAEILEA